ncbi:MAG: PEP-CTERM sorting domain-containing protein [Methylacidiphilales bacterium]|nr:PEP-CTERM sorting domain-containing protein [Candidatus Methylacidiphilales bacterium]
MKNLYKNIYITLGLLSLSALMQANAAVITDWTFGSTNSGPDNSPAPTIGSGVATALGMTNSYLLTSGSTITGTGTFTGGTTSATFSVADSDILATTGDPNGFANTWRIRGNGSGGGNGWALQAPEYSQGAQFSTSTVGYQNITFSFDLYSTTQGVANAQEQYTLDGSTWTNIGSLLTVTSNGWLPTQTITFSSAANNDANFGVRIVSAYSPTLAIPNYGSADGAQSGVYNNNSGNWRFADVVFSGTAVPEPSTYALLLGGFALLVAMSRFRRAAVSQR